MRSAVLRAFSIGTILTLLLAHPVAAFEMNGGCTVIIDPEGDVRYSIYKRFDGAARRERQHAAITGPLKQFWKKDAGKWTLRPNMLRTLHAAR